MLLFWFSSPNLGYAFGGPAGDGMWSGEKPESFRIDSIDDNSPDNNITVETLRSFIEGVAEPYQTPTPSTGVTIDVILPTAIILTTGVALAFVLTHKKKEQI